MQNFRNTLELNPKHKAVPYGGFGELRDDGDANYGFKYVKDNEKLLKEIPELMSDPALFELVSSINTIQTGLFSIGCVSGEVADADGFRYSGYVEFTFNSVSAISDAKNYFPIFFHFDRFLHESQFPVLVNYSWELQPATFTEVNASGYTCSVFINTHYSPSKEDALLAWSEALSVLAKFLISVPIENTDFIYPQ